MEQKTAQILPLLPLTRGVVLPHMVVTLALDSDESKGAVTAALGGDKLVLLVPRIGDRYARIGTVARVDDAGELPNGEQAVIMRGLTRALIGSGVAGAGEAVWVQADLVEDTEPESEETAELARAYRATVEAVLDARGVPEASALLRGVTGAGALADTAGYSPDLSFEQRIEILETLDPLERLKKALAWAKETLAELGLKDKIKQEVASGMEKSQREFLLRQQLQAIKKELGEDSSDVVSELRTKIDEAGMPEKVAIEAHKELDRLERTSEQSPEAGWIRTYLEWLVEMPWSKRSEDRLDLSAARAVLDADHTGLADVKDRILEYLAVRKLRAERNLDAASGRGSGAILTLVGPPGVGKTSLGESVARALGREFVRMSLGGVRDEAEIRGHRRTYVGAQPGRIVRAIKEAGTMNPVFMLDEVDKVGSDWRGDPSSALLEVLDPAQNHSFKDHYLEVELDLSEVLFVCTANVAETIPAPLLDRMEVIHLDGYTEYEKLAIARDHLVGRQLERNALAAEEVVIEDEALTRIITEHTREAGVRGLERQLAKVLRKVAGRVAEAATEVPVTISANDVPAYLGKARFHFEAAERTSVPGVATGLAVTGTGGDVLFIEATAMEGEPGLTLTGQLGDVMKESAQIALSYVRSHAQRLGAEDVGSRRIHVHVPAGAVPKDGPSAGVAMVTAMASLLSDRPVRSSVGMTGEVTLQGKVLPIGGVKQKVLAAHRAGLKEVVLPLRNEPDLDDIPADIAEELRFHLVSEVSEVLAVALGKQESAAAA
ncbi:MAG TPA: endopeptidase La [Actinomycetota bacterium]|nr:endopeptidase La [Actinomycetota bacterium]